MHFWVLVNRAIVRVSLVVEELSNGKHSKRMSVTQHLQTVESFAISLLLFSVQCMSTTPFVHECPLPREDFVSLSYVLFIHIMVLLVKKWPE